MHNWIIDKTSEIIPLSEPGAYIHAHNCYLLASLGPSDEFASGNRSAHELVLPPLGSPIQPTSSFGVPPKGFSKSRT